jgi:hypothetical protein
MIKNLLSIPVNLPPITSGGQQRDTKRNIAKAEYDREQISGFLQKIVEIDKEKGVKLTY